MALKPSQITRRNFLQRAGMLVTSLGVVGGVQSGLMENIIRKANRKWGSEVMAAPGTAGVHYCVELLFRAGFQFNSLLPFPGASSVAATQASALNVYSSPANVVKTTWTGQKNPVYFAKFTAGRGADLLGTTIAGINNAAGKERLGVAISETIVTADGQHRGDFASRIPNSSAPTPAQLHATMAPAVDVNGIAWNANGVGVNEDNSGAGLPALAKVSSGATFQSLFKNVPMYFQLDELKLIVGEINQGVPVTGKEGAIAWMDSNYIAAKAVPGGNSLFQVSQAGRGQAQISKLGQLVTAFNTNGPTIATGNPALFTAGTGGNPGTFSDQNITDQTGTIKNNGSLMEPLNWALAAFSTRSATSMTIALESQDWHSNNGTGNIDNPSEKQGAWNIYVGDALAGFLKAAAATPDPFSTTGGSIADSLLISLSSEFTRTAQGRGSDNGDGGSQAMLYIGSKVVSGAYGDIAPFNSYNPVGQLANGSISAGTLIGFNPTTMAVGGTPTATESDLWKTTGGLLGLPSGSLSMVSGTALPIVKP